MLATLSVPSVFLSSVFLAHVSFNLQTVLLLSSTGLQTSRGQTYGWRRIAADEPSNVTAN